MTFDLMEDTLKSLLLSTVKITSKKRVLGTGQISLYEMKDFNIRLILSSGKKIELLYPFDIITKDNFIYFDYTLQHIHQDDVLWRPRVNRLIKNKRNKYYDLLLSIELL